MGNHCVGGLAPENLGNMISLEALLTKPAAQAGAQLRMDQAAHQAARTTQWSSERAA